MNVNINSKLTTGSVSTTQSSGNNNNSTSSSSFSDELTSLSTQNNAEETEKVDGAEETENSEDIDGVIDGLENAVAEVNEKLNQTDENEDGELKENAKLDDNFIKQEGSGLINNDMNVQELKDALAFQMNANMNFNSDGQQFSDLMNDAQTSKLSATKAELAEENAILSTMEENEAIANRNKAAIKTVTNNEGVKKVDTNSNITVETVVKFDDVIMSKADVDFFTNIVEKGAAEMTAETAKSAQVSKTLADLIAKSMKDNQPIRINFDNDISVIIKIGRDGKISADFLPSSQVAEAYLKENLPLLRQKFDDNNLEYDSLNHRRQKQDDKEDQKKGRKDE